MTDWTRMAAPQADHYDTEVILERVQTTTTPRRPQPYVRRPAGWGAQICDGEVAVRHTPQQLLGPPRFADAMVDHPNLLQAAEHLRRWPVGYQQFKRLIDTVHPLTDTTVSLARRAVHLGACSGSEEARFGALCATVDSVPGLAQAMVQQMAHQKLRALGVAADGAEALLVNDPGQRYRCPLGRGELRPMTAVLHATYAFVHVVCLDVHMIQGEADPTLREDLLMLLARNVPRVEAGLEQLAQHAHTDEEGARFVAALHAWAAAVLRRGHEALDAHGYGMVL